MISVNLNCSLFTLSAESSLQPLNSDSNQYPQTDHIKVVNSLHLVVNSLHLLKV